MKLHIDSLAHGGAGVARDAAGRIVFVQGACPGDDVEVAVVAERDRYAEAKTLRVLSPGPARVAPECRYFGMCGGCQWQHIAIDAQREAKRAILRDSLERIGRIAAPKLRETVSAGGSYGYRNKIELAAAADREGGFLLGMYEAGTEKIAKIAKIDACLLLPGKYRSLPEALRKALSGIAGNGGLGLSRVVVRVASNTPDVEIDLWGAPGPFPRREAGRSVREAVPECDTVARVLVRDANRERSSAKFEVLSGRGDWRERLSGFEFRVSPTSFFQVNTTAAEALVSLVLLELAPDRSDRVLDLYCGVGTFTLPLASVAGEVVAVESSMSAMSDLDANLETAGLHASTVHGDASRALSDMGRFVLAVVDPPRSGLAAEVISRLAAALPRRIVYVSCDPASLARDAKRLAACGFEFVRATPVDLFPQTFHIETVAVFDRVGR